MKSKKKRENYLKMFQIKKKIFIFLDYQTIQNYDWFHF